MLLKLKKIAKQIVCSHTEIKVYRWHWCHGVNGDEPSMIELEYKCNNCGAIRYAHFKGQKAKEVEDALLKLTAYTE